MVRAGEGPVKRLINARHASAKAKELIKAFALRHGVLVRTVPVGHQGDAFADQAALLRGSLVKCVFDVGAYEGQTTRAYRNLFPRAEIHCFEPVPASFARLEQAISTLPRVVANRVAISDTRAVTELHINRFLATSSRFPPAENVADIVGHGLVEAVGTQLTESITIDDYCRERGIDQIDVLKLDIQGGELAALRGAQDMLREERVSLVYTEVLVRRLYDGQPTAGDLLTLFDRYGYRLYGLYDFHYGGDSSLYQMDAIVLAPGLHALV